MFPMRENDYKEFISGDSTLITAAKREHVQCINAWIKAGADVNHVNEDNDSALVLCCVS